MNDEEILKAAAIWLPFFAAPCDGDCGDEHCTGPGHQFDDYAKAHELISGLAFRLNGALERIRFLEKQRDQLQAANTAEVERRRKAEAENKRTSERTTKSIDDDLRRHGLDPKNWGS